MVAVLDFTGHITLYTGNTKVCFCCKFILMISLFLQQKTTYQKHNLFINMYIFQYLFSFSYLKSDFKFKK